MNYVKKVLAINVRAFFGHLETAPESKNRQLESEFDALYKYVSNISLVTYKIIFLKSYLVICFIALKIDDVSFFRKANTALYGKQVSGREPQVFTVLKHKIKQAKYCGKSLFSFVQTSF
jgi:hypothetical protein